MGVETRKIENEKEIIGYYKDLMSNFVQIIEYILTGKVNHLEMKNAYDNFVDNILKSIKVEL
ncbi:MAG: hypothetical protein K2M17_00835 [Bacilli bacterium]|nr:hypothetical protein [Bacilli bacterium]